MKRILLASVCLVPLYAHAQPVPPAPGYVVYPGCALPNPKPTRRTWYADPVNGSSTLGDGSQAKPWATLADIANGVGTTKGKIQSGDDVLLLNGDHGVVNFHKWLMTDFVRFMAAPGHKPLVEQMQVAGVTKMVFSGIKFQSTRPSTQPYRAMVDVSASTFFGASSDLIFDRDTFSTTDDPSGWTDDQWINSPWSAGLVITQKCMTVSNNVFDVLINALGLSGDSILALNNNFTRLNNDGIEHTSSNIIIKGNHVSKGHHTANQALHVDCIQGWSRTVNGVVLKNTNVKIDSNYCEKVPDVPGTVAGTNLPVSYMQGITIFDGQWDGVEVTNNIVINDTYHGISLYGVHNAKIMNNTVIQSNPAQGNWIGVFNGKDKLPSTNVIVRNNMARSITGINPANSVTADHNIAFAQYQWTDPATGAAKWVNAQGPVAGQPDNAINAGALNYFTKIDVANVQFDVHLLKGSPAIGTASADQIPSIDFDGFQRVPPYDLGALAYRPVCQ